MAHPQPLADLALDEARRRLYVVNTAANAGRSLSAPRRIRRGSTNTIKTDATPLSIAMSRSGRYLYVACYGASSLEIIDLSSTTFSTSVGDAAGEPAGGRGRFQRARSDQHDRDGHGRNRCC